MTWVSGEENKLVTMYDECKNSPEMAKALGKSVDEVNAKLRELGLEPSIRPTDLDLCCPSCSADIAKLKLLDFGMTTGKWYYKCAECSYIFPAP
jgi:hypothetical protein